MVASIPNPGIELGVDDFITKPFNESFLKARVRSLLKMKFLNREPQI